MMAKYFLHGSYFFFGLFPKLAKVVIFFTQKIQRLRSTGLINNACIMAAGMLLLQGLFKLLIKRRKAKITTSMLNSLEGISCSDVTGALYAFAKIELPQKAIEEAKASTFNGL